MCLVSLYVMCGGEEKHQISTFSEIRRVSEGSVFLLSVFTQSSLFVANSQDAGEAGGGNASLGGISLNESQKR